MSALIELKTTAENRDALALKLAVEVTVLLRQDIAKRGAASLVVSGGSTPKPFFNALSRQSLDWSKVMVTLADERWVPASDPDSNETLVRDNLFINEAAKATFVSLYRSNIAPAEAITNVAADLSAMPSPFTVVVLGMGDDGHTASLFPDAPELEAGMDMQGSATSLMMHPPSVTQPRITLTLKRLLNAQHLFLHITGDSKLEVLKRALAADTNPLPIARVAAATGLAMMLYWTA